MSSINETIEKHGNYWKVYSKKKINGRRKLLGTHSTREKAVDQLQAIEASKARATTEAKQDNFSEFADIREAGAEKIANTAKEKGGLALLTWHHFKVKLPYYKKAAAGQFDLEKAHKEYQNLLEKLYHTTSGDLNISQTDFQELVGKIEVLGELIIKEEENGKLVESKIMSYSQFLNERKKESINPAYLTRDAKEMKSEIKKHAKKSDDDDTAYTSHPDGGWKADYSSSGKKYKTSPSKYTKAFAKKYGTK